MLERLKTIKNHRVVALVLRAQKRFTEIGGTSLSNGIALQLFLSIFPLLLVAIAVIGFLAADDPTLADDVIDNLSLDADESFAEIIEGAVVAAAQNKETTGAVALAGMLFSGLNVIGAVQRAIDRSWQTTGKGLKEKLRAIGWLLGAVVIFAATTALSTIINFLPGWFAPLSVLLGLVVNVALFLWTFVILGRLRLPIRTHLPGAILCAVGFEILKLVGTVYVPRLVARSSELYGPIGAILALLGWLAFFGRVIVLGALANAIAYEDAHGTVRVEIGAPRIPGTVAVEADRAGAVIDRRRA